MSKDKNATDRRKARVRRHIKAVSNGRLRLTVYRSARQIYAQIIDDAKGHTLCQASSLEKAMREQLKNGGTVEAAGAVGKALAERAKAAGISEVVFDRGAYIYHGRVKALAESAREGGLSF